MIELPGHKGAFVNPDSWDRLPPGLQGRHYRDGGVNRILTSGTATKGPLYIGPRIVLGATVQLLPLGG